jgi:ABC-type Co2+ transport system permease subunit
MQKANTCVSVVVAFWCVLACVYWLIVNRKLQKGTAVMQSSLLPKYFLASLQMSAPFPACTSVHCERIKFSVLAEVWPYDYVQIP